ncbi:MAG: sigma 54-interacting transcriptional regulator [Candidatus Eisenbacteria bacterium]
MKTGAKSKQDQARQRLEEHLRFESLIVEMTTNFLKGPISEVDEEVRTWLRRLGEFFNVDRVTLWWPVEEERTYRVTHAWAAPGLPDATGFETSKIPWTDARVGRGGVFSFSRLADLPETASSDKEVYKSLGTKSLVAAPTEVHESMFAGLTIATLRSERDWGSDVPDQVKLAAEILASALLRRRTEQELVESEERLRLVFDGSHDLITITDAQARPLWANKAWVELFGPVSEYQEEPLHLIHPEDLDRAAAAWSALVTAETKRIDLEYRYRLASGEWRTFDSSGFKMVLDGKDRFCIVAHDVTERTLARERLKRETERAQTYLDIAGVVMVVIESDQTVSLINKRGCDLLGCSEKDIIGKNWFETAVPEGERDRVLNTFRKIMAGEIEPVEYFENRIVTRSGEERIIAWHNSAIRDETGQITRTLSSGEDITERKRAKAELENALLEISALKERVQAENIYLREEIRMAHLHGDIMGQSDAMKSVLVHAEQVAPTDSTVLILGETGTGKERLARAIHDMSPRKDRPLVIVNCAAMPATLVESELFGREKGAYTGATTRQIGRFEVADDGTIFLDEIGELSRETQAKLLRVLQEGELERLGSTETISVDVRVIAATNRDLENAVRDREFRDDLFYRLNVYPIAIPPLRDRREDISPLVQTFIKEFNEKMGKRVESVSRRSMNELESYSWPGNVRELRNIIERAMIRATDKTLRVDVPRRKSQPGAEDQTLIIMERQHIMRVLEQTGWRVRGKGGAAEALGLKATTLESRMKKLGIKRPGPAKPGSDPI